MALRIEKQYNGQVVNINEEKKTITLYFSTAGIDREGEIVLANGIDFTNFMKNPVLVDSHNYGTIENVIGKVENLTIDSKGLLGTVKYFAGEGNVKADWAYTLEKNGIGAYSIGFIPLEKTPGDGEVKIIYTKSELLEISQVIIPANPEAVMNSVEYVPVIKEFKQLRGEEMEEKEIITKPEPEVTENTIRIRVEDPDKFVQDSFRTITISADKGIKAVIGKYKTDPDGPTHTQSYIFDKDKWTVEEAQSWVNERKSFETIETKAGRVLSESNRTKIKETLVLLKKVQEALQELLEISEPITDSLESEEAKLKKLFEGIANSLKKQSEG